MAIHMNDDVTVPQSTGLVATPGPTTHTQPGETVASATVPLDAGPVTVKFGPSGQKPAGTVETPGPVTIEQPGLVTKVVKAPAKVEARSTTAETAQPTPTASPNPAQPAPPAADPAGR